MRDSLEDRIRRHHGPDSTARRPGRRPARPGPRGSAAACPLANHRNLGLQRSGALSSLAGRDGLVDSPRIWPWSARTTPGPTGRAGCSAGAAAELLFRAASL